MKHNTDSSTLKTIKHWWHI